MDPVLRANREIKFISVELHSDVNEARLFGALAFCSDCAHTVVFPNTDLVGVEAAEADIVYAAGRFSVAGTDVSMGLFELARRQFVHDWGDIQTEIEKEIKRREMS